MNIIVDIDNTLCINEKRFLLAKKQNGKINWDIVYNTNLIYDDLPNYPMIDLVKRYKKDLAKIILITGRPESVKGVTKKWLKKYDIPYDSLYMRKAEDLNLPAHIFKKKVYMNFINEKIFCAFDDDDSIVDMWLSLGIPSFKVFAVIKV